MRLCFGGVVIVFSLPIVVLLFVLVFGASAGFGDDDG